MPAEYFKYLPQNWRLYSLSLFNRVMADEAIREQWAVIFFSMLYKKSNIDDPENYRSIALINTIVKTFTQILLNRCMRWCEYNEIIPEFQSGFRRSRSCLDNIFVLNSIVQFRLSRKASKLFCLFIDFRKAFPSADHMTLWTKLEHIGFSSKIIKILMSLY